ncbi:AraC-type DNA-binding protein [Flavobacterium swingsii]|uniref:AraC-type DNA-binding protein n=1 Tax=Flavobacterium swingsii TaxID=498292 RepID=A0A1I0V7M7_9FLAO|nr:AraC family transcriptional regulator [Flavobacterium swingsii]SFA72341.1 AraC-type DNA-binding protein [Flavobacterium swingsii]
MYLKINRYNQFDSLEVKESMFKEFNLPNHFHDTYCIGLLNNGIKKCTIENTPQLIHSNSVSIINPYQIHSDKNVDNEDCLFRMIYLNKDVLNYFTKKITGKNNENIIFTNDLITDSLVNSSILSFFNETDNGILLEHKLEKLIQILINNKYSIDNIDINYDNKNAIDDSIQKARLNFFDKIDIAKMSQESKISKYQFIRYFKKKTGLTPASYILLHRINCSKTLLMKDIPIGEIALEVGFYDHAQFCKFFKYYTNTSPTEYRYSCNIIQA